MMTELGYKTYENYEESNVQWIGKLPSHWKVERSKWLFSDRKERARCGELQLAATQKYGVIPQSEFMEIEGRRVTQVFLDFDILKHVDAGDFVMSMRSFQGGIEYSAHTGCVSSAYVALRPKPNIEPAFFRYLLKSSRYIEALQSTSNLVRDGQALRFENFSSVDLFILPMEEQRAIAAFLDDKCTKIDEAVKIKEDQIALLRERRQIIIQDAVTRGLNPVVPMKDSGIDWIGQIPAHWEVKRFKHFFSTAMGETILGEHLIVDGKIPVYSATEGDHFFGYVNKSKISLSSGDLVIPARGNSIGFPKLVAEPSTCSQTTIYAKKLRGISSEFVFFYLLSCKRFLFQFVQTAIPQITVDEVKNNILLLPPPREQSELVKYCDDITRRYDGTIEIKRSQIETLNEYKTSLINAAVTGKIKVI